MSICRKYQLPMCHEPIYSKTPIIDAHLFIYDKAIVGSTVRIGKQQKTFRKCGNEILENEKPNCKPFPMYLTTTDHDRSLMGKKTLTMDQKGLIPLPPLDRTGLALADQQHRRTPTDH